MHHTIAYRIYSWGIKIDVIPGRVNSAVTFRLLNKPKNSSLSAAVIIFSRNIIINYLLIILLLIIYSFEILNSLVQLFIFNLLSIEYLEGEGIY